MKNCKGILSALMTPFDKNGKIDETVLRSYIRHNIDTMKVDGLYVGGSTGEALLTSTKERMDILEIVKDEVKGKVSLIAHVGSLNIDEAITIAQKAEELNYDMISSVTPYYYPFSFENVKIYYETILKETNKTPFVIYFIPFLANSKISLDQFGELFENDRVAGIKYTSSDLYLLERVVKNYPNKQLWAGFDELLIAYASYGLDSGIGSTYNIQAPFAKKILTHVKNKELDKALEVQQKMNDVIDVLLKVGIYPALKECLSYYNNVGYGYCKKPFGTISESDKKILREMFDKYLSDF